MKKRLGFHHVGLRIEEKLWYRIMNENGNVSEWVRRTLKEFLKEARGLENSKKIRRYLYLEEELVNFAKEKLPNLPLTEIIERAIWWKEAKRELLNR